MEASAIITIIISAIGLFAGGFWLKAKGKLSQAINLGRQALELASALENALKDDKVTKDEIEEIKKELSEVKGAWKVLLEKKK